MRIGLALEFQLNELEELVQNLLILSAIQHFLGVYQANDIVRSVQLAQPVRCLHVWVRRLLEVHPRLTRGNVIAILILQNVRRYLRMLRDYQILVFKNLRILG